MNIRNSIFWAHLVSGIAVGAVVLIMAVTGMLLAFRTQIIDWASRDARHIAPVIETNRLNINALTGAVRTAYPNEKPRMLILKADPTASFAVNLGREAGTVYVNPYTAVVLGKDAAVSGFMEGVESWHRWLAMEGPWKALGHNIKGVCNILFLFLVLTGFYLWWPRHSTFPTLRANMKLHKGLKGKARDWNQHSVIGFWFAPFLIVISVTGVIMTYPWATNALYRMTGNEPPALVEREAEGRKAGGREGLGQRPATDFDGLFARAQAQVPNWSMITLRVPKGDGPVTLSIEEKGQLYPQRSQLTLDVSTAGIVKWEPYAAQNQGRKLRALARFLHTGEAGGIAGEIIAFFTAAAASVLVWTGFSMAWRRFFPAGKI